MPTATSPCARPGARSLPIWPTTDFVVSPIIWLGWSALCWIARSSWPYSLPLFVSMSGRLEPMVFNVNDPLTWQQWHERRLSYLKPGLRRASARLPGAGWLLERKLARVGRLGVVAAHRAPGACPRISPICRRPARCTSWPIGAATVKPAGARVVAAACASGKGVTEPALVLDLSGGLSEQARGLGSHEP